MSITNDLQLIADQLVDALDRGAQIPCLSGNRNNFDVETAYAISDIVSNKRIARGEEIIGIKIGFTNESLWEEYNVHDPIFAPMYSSTQLETGKTVDLSRFAQPKIEPELFFTIASIPNSQMTDTELLACCSHYGHGIEIVQSVFPDWTFTLPDTVAAFALHGAYLRGESYEVPQAPQSQRDLVKDLQNFSLELHMNGELVETGLAKNILSSGPLNALRHLARLNEKGISQHKIAVGQVITTGTVTSAYQLSHGQTWISKFTGLDIAGMTLEFRTE